MTAIEKAKDLFWCEECDSMVTENHRCEQWSHVTRIPSKAVIAIEALAALEAEKPAEDDLSDDDIDMIANLSGVSSGERAGFIFGIRFYTKTLLPVKIQQYAEAHHERKMKEEADWNPIHTAPWGREVLLRGSSGYMVPHSCFVVNGYRVKDWHQGDWNDATGTHLSERGWVPTHWREL